MLATKLRVVTGEEVCCVVPARRNFYRERKYPCGHTGPVHYRLQLYGAMTNKVYSSHAKCGECLLLEAMHSCIQCGFCDSHIRPGEHVALFQPDDGDIAIKPHAVRVNENNSVIVGACCADEEAIEHTWNGKTTTPIQSLPFDLLYITQLSS